MPHDEDAGRTLQTTMQSVGQQEEDLVADIIAAERAKREQEVDAISDAVVDKLRRKLTPVESRLTIGRGAKPKANRVEKKRIVDGWYLNPALQQEINQDAYCNEIGIDVSTLRRWRRHVYGK